MLRELVIMALGVAVGALPVFWPCSRRRAFAQVVLGLVMVAVSLL